MNYKDYIIWYFIGINIFTFIVFGLDKFMAIKNKRRISEKDLFILSILGGCFLEFLGMFIFHHKTKKFKFYIVNIVFIIFYILLLI